MTSESPGRRAIWQWIASLTVGAFCLWLFFRNLDLAEVHAALQQARWDWLLLGVLSVVGVAVIKAMRWWFFYPSAQRPSSWRQVFPVLMTSQMLNVLIPVRVGELARMGLMLQEQCPVATTFSTIVVEKSLDLLAAGLMVALVIPTTALPDWFPSSSGLMMGITGTVLLTLLVVVWMARKQVRVLLMRLIAFRNWLPSKWQDRLVRVVDQLLAGLGAIAEVQTALPVLTLTMLSWLASVFTMVAMLMSFGLPAAWHVAFVLSLTMYLSNVVPTPPALVGVVGAVTVMTLSWFGVSRPDAAALGVVLNVVLVAPLVLIGGWSTWLRFSRLTRGTLGERWAQSLGLERNEVGPRPNRRVP